MKIRLAMRQKILLGGTAACLLLILAARVVYLPLLGAIGERRATLQDLRVKISDAGVLTAELPEQEVTLQETQGRYDTLQGWIQSGDSMARILEAVSLRAKDHRLELVAVQPPAGEEVSTLSLGFGLTLREVPLHLTLSGRYWNIGEFLGRLAEAPFITSVRSLKMTESAAGSGTLTADLVLAVHLAQP